MPVFQITTPEGKYKITAAEGATEEQVRADFLKQVGGGSPAPEQKTGLGNRLDQAAVAATKGLARGTEFAVSALNPVRLIKDTINSARGVITGEPGLGTTSPASPVSEALEKAAPGPTDPAGKLIAGASEAIGNPLSYGPGGFIKQLIAAGTSGVGSAIGEMVGGKAGAVAGSMLGGLAGGWSNLKLDINDTLRRKTRDLYKQTQATASPQEKKLMEAIILGDETKASKMQIMEKASDLFGKSWVAATLKRNPVKSIATSVINELVKAATNKVTPAAPSALMPKIQDLIKDNQRFATRRATNTVKVNLSIDAALKRKMAGLYMQTKDSATPQEKALMEAIIAGDKAQASKLLVAPGGAPTTSQLQDLLTKHKGRTGDSALFRAGRAGVRESEKRYGGVE